MTATILGWLKDLGPLLLALAVAVATVLFQRWQVRLAKETLRHDLYDRRFAIYMAFHELLLALAEKDIQESYDEIMAHLRKADIARTHVPFLLDDPKIDNYLKELNAEVLRIIGEINFVRDPNARLDPKAFIERAGHLGPDKLNLANRHLPKLSQLFKGPLTLTDFRKKREP